MQLTLMLALLLCMVFSNVTRDVQNLVEVRAAKVPRAVLANLQRVGGGRVRGEVPAYTCGA